MSELKTFLAQTAPQATPLGTLTLTLGDALPFCLLTLRSFHPEGDEGGDLSITRRTFGARATMLSGEDVLYGDETGETRARLPTLLRIAARARDFGANENRARLALWSPAGTDPIEGALIQGDAAQDILAVPEAFEDLRGDHSIHLPALRLSDGAAALVLDLGDGTNELAHFLGFDPAHETLFGHVAITLDKTTKPGRLFWPVTVVAQGIEFPATLPDPTIGMSATKETARLNACLRLEVDDDRGAYRLRLIGPGATGELAPPRERLQQVVTSLINAEAPQRYRIDLGGDTPPLLWPLTHAKGQLALSQVPGATPHVLAEIDPDRIDLRLVTSAAGVGEGSALAQVALSRVEMHSSDNDFKLIAHAGQPVQKPTYDLTYRKNGSVWSGSFTGTFGRKPVALPLDQLRDRLTTRYRDAGLLDAENETAPYAFFALRDGWFQHPLPAPDAAPEVPGLEGAKGAPEAEDRARSALSGRILFSASDPGGGADSGLPRALELTSAEGLMVTTTWRGNEDGMRRLRKFVINPIGEIGSIYGFLYVADTSPTAFEAVPDWTLGPATVREVALGFDSSDRDGASFRWTAEQEGTDTWDLAFDLGPSAQVGDAETAPPALGWVTMQDAPFITNYPMSRSARSASTPSRSRGLFPRALSGRVHLRFQMDQGGSVENDLPVLKGPEAVTAPGAPFGPAPVDPLRDRFVQSAILPTLHGIEFKPDPDSADWQFTAALRFDYPVLDELFAWSDLPPVEPDGALAPRPGPEAEPADKPAPIVTALHPERLVALWRDAEQRMQLTWTQDAVITNTLSVNAGPVDIRLDTLAYPYRFREEAAVQVDAQTLFGDLLLNGREGLAAAAVGLGGAVGPKDVGVELQDTTESGSAKVHVTGYGIDQYPAHPMDTDDTDAAEHLADARGAALRTIATRDGTLRATRTYARNARTDKIENRPVLLATLPQPHGADMSIGRASAEVQLYLRDLPIDPEDLSFLGIINAGDDQGAAGPQGNPIEGTRGNTGQALDRGNFLFSLYEWRFFQARDRSDEAEILGEYDIPVGPFRFRPLRLIDAELAEQGGADKPLGLASARILGSLSFRADGQQGHDDFAFGVDRIYDRDDLFVFSMGDTPMWQSAKIASGAAPNTLTWSDRAPTLTFTRSLPVVADRKAGWFTSVDADGNDQPVDVTIELGFDIYDHGMEPETATLRARLFGAQRTITGGKVALSSDDGGTLDITFEPDFPCTPPLPDSLKDVTIRARCSAQGDTQDLSIDGTVELRSQSGSGPVVFALGKTATRWLDLDLGHLETPPNIDHQSGVLTCKVQQEIAGGTAPLFGLPIGAKGAKMADLEISFAEVLDSSDKVAGRVLHFLADLSLGNGDSFRLNHEILRGAGDADLNAARLTWQSEQQPSPIHWLTLKGLELEGSPSLMDIAGGALAPPADTANSPSGVPGRLLTLTNQGDSITHSFQFRLSDFHIDLNRLQRDGDGKLSPADGPLRGLAQVRHRLVDGRWSRSWLSCDHIALTTAAAMTAEARQVLSFVPRHSHQFRKEKTSPALRYRGKPEHNGSDHLAEGMARLENANLSGWHDAGMVEHLWTKIDQNQVFVLAVAPLWMPLDAGHKAFQINLPWAYGLPKDVVLQTPPQDSPDIYRIPTMESWAAHAMASTRRAAPVGLSTHMREDEMLAALADSRTDRPKLRDMLPTSPGFFESWVKGAAADIDSADLHRRAPYFLRAMLALAAYRQANGAQVDVMTLVPDMNWNDKAYQAPTRAATRARLARLRDRAVPTAPGDPSRVPVDLVILGRHGARMVARYRQALVTDQDWGRPAELFDAAHRLMEGARFALMRHGPQGRVVGRSVSPPTDPLARSGVALTPRDADIVASPALGWPMEPTQGHTAHAPGFEAELALQSPQAGFSGRGQRTLWPATAEHPPRQSGDIQSLGLRFSDQVVFDRGSAPFPHDGPAARHLVAANARRRVPLPVVAKDGSAPPWAPIMPPVVDRLLIGRRAGVLDITTVSATLVTQAPGPALDAGWPGMGQPATSGPVIGAQMRNPRGMILPPHPKDDALFEPGLSTAQILRFSRRTFVSRTDLERGRGDSKSLTPFLYQQAFSDVLRLEGPGALDWRMSLTGSGGTLTLPAKTRWEGMCDLFLELKAVDAAGDDAATQENIAGLFKAVDGWDLKHAIHARLNIGARNWDFSVRRAWVVESGVRIELEMPSTPKIETDPSPLEFVNQLLRQANPDTPMWIDLGFRRTAGVVQTEQPVLPTAGLVRFQVPVLLDPERPREIPVRSETLCFGDPSYDRALGSPTLARDFQAIHADDTVERLRLAVDRQQANADTQLHIAFDLIDDATGGFATKGSVKEGGRIELGFERILLHADSTGEEPAQQDLLLWRADIGHQVNQLYPRMPHMLRLGDLYVSGQRAMGSPLKPGDILRLTARYNVGNTTLATETLDIPIVAGPVIPPAPSVFDFIEETGEELEDKVAKAARLRLHAPAPLPSRVEYPALLVDLGLGHVRREGLFVWHYGVPNGTRAPWDNRPHLLKTDRSGGTQLPQ
ncbi:hypothetical protein [Leisingera sp. M658]|uniref:hypothetical protein n=1 Tax=Leisingera sp. M658 TaxID=2867015 RepID=UPI0021A57DEB|nr:hypothetical protein [Leisingera sp. M658]UWQ74044.1 hypothetical protein K3724_16100 [Leisingera sp. M658]